MAKCRISDRWENDIWTCLCTTCLYRSSSWWKRMSWVDRGYCLHHSDIHQDFGACLFIGTSTRSTSRRNIVFWTIWIKNESGWMVWNMSGEDTVKYIEKVDDKNPFGLLLYNPPRVHSGGYSFVCRWAWFNCVNCGSLLHLLAIVTGVIEVETIFITMQLCKWGQNRPFLLQGFSFWPHAIF